jgi:hypothetical protein
MHAMNSFDFQNLQQKPENNTKYQKFISWYKNLRDYLFFCYIITICPPPVQNFECDYIYLYI